MLLAELERLADRVRHPALSLVSFLAGPVEIDETEDTVDRIPLPCLELLGQRRDVDPREAAPADHIGPVR